MQYARRSTEVSFYRSPVDLDYQILTKNYYLNTQTDLLIKSMPLSTSEYPRSPGFMCAIDAEFVAMTKADVEICSDGTKKVLRPSRYSLARVSVVRGEGPAESGICHSLI